MPTDNEERRIMRFAYADPPRIDDVETFCNKCGHIGPRSEHGSDGCPYHPVPLEKPWMPGDIIEDDCCNEWVVLRSYTAGLHVAVSVEEGQAAHAVIPWDQIEDGEWVSASNQTEALKDAPEWVWCVARWECVPNGDYAGWRCFEGRCPGPHRTLYIGPERTREQPTEDAS